MQVGDTTSGTTKNRLRLLREQHDLELFDVAALIRKSTDMVRRYEDGRSEPPLDVLRILAARYGETVEHLMGWDEGPNQEVA